jgi:hypothetical protein
MLEAGSAGHMDTRTKGKMHVLFVSLGFTNELLSVRVFETVSGCRFELKCLGSGRAEVIDRAFKFFIRELFLLTLRIPTTSR